MYFSEALLGALLAHSAFAAVIDKRSPIEAAANSKSNLGAAAGGTIVNPPAAVTSINDNDGVASSGFTTKKSYSGDGTPGQGWPSLSQWISFNDMFNNNKPNMLISCGNETPAEANDSQDEVNDIRSAIESIAQSSGVDHRLILAVIMQESEGCVRVHTTTSPTGGITNPGLMQDYEGSHTCNGPNGVQNPCPQSEITGMIQDGTVGSSGVGLAPLINVAQSDGATGAQTFYVAARWYNSGQGNPAVGGDLSGAGSTNSYASDIANRLIGFVG